MKGCAEYLSGRYKEALESFNRMGKLSSDGHPASKMKWFQEEDNEMQLFNTPSAFGGASPAKPEIGTTNMSLVSMQSFALFALGRYAEADKIAIRALDTAPDRLDFQAFARKMPCGAPQLSAGGGCCIPSDLPKDAGSLATHELYISSLMRIDRNEDAASAVALALQSSEGSPNLLRRSAATSVRCLVGTMRRLLSTTRVSPG